MSGRLNFFLIGFLIAALLLRLFYFNWRKKPHFQDGQRVVLEAILTSQPQIFSKSQQFKIGKVKVITSVYPQYFYGEKLRIIGTIKNGVLVFPKIEVREKGKGNLLLAKIFALRREIISLFESFLPEPEASLFLGIFLGAKRNLSPSFYFALRRTGTLHVVVASGMNVTILAGVVLALLNLLFKRRLAAILTTAFIFFYALLVGFEPPIIRAAIMATMALFGQFFGRLNWGVLSLLFTGYLMLFLNPSLLADLGFQLSFLSTAGILLIKPLFKFKNKHFLLLKEDLTTTFSAQVFTLPIILASFGRYQGLSLLVNTLVLWTTPILMGFGAAVAGGGFLSPPLGQIFAFLALPFLFYFEKVVSFFARFSFGRIKARSFPFILTLGYYFLLTAVLIFCYKKRRKNGNSQAHDREPQSYHILRGG